MLFLTAFAKQVRAFLLFFSVTLATSAFAATKQAKPQQVELANIFESKPSYSQNCKFMHWAPHFETINQGLRSIPEIAHNDYFYDLLVEYQHCFSQNAGDFIVNIFKGHKNLRNNIIRRLYSPQIASQNTLSLDEVLALTDEEFFTFGHAKLVRDLDIKSFSNLVTRTKDSPQLQALFPAKAHIACYLDMVDRYTALDQTYRMFRTNDLCRLTFLKPMMDCAACKKINVARIEKLGAIKNPKVRDRVEANFRILLCKKCQDKGQTAAGVFAPCGLGEHEPTPEQENKAPFAQNPSLYLWNQDPYFANQACELTKNFKEDLKLTRGDERQQYEDLLLRLKRTQTYYGNAVFEKMFLLPCSNVSVLKMRQALIKKLLEDDGWYNGLRNALNKVRVCQARVNNFIMTARNQKMFEDGNSLLNPQGTEYLRLLEDSAKAADNMKNNFPMFKDALNFPWLKNILAVLHRNPFIIGLAPIAKLGVTAFGLASPVYMTFGGKNGISGYWKEFGKSDYAPKYRKDDKRFELLKQCHEQFQNGGRLKKLLASAKASFSIRGDKELRGKSASLSDSDYGKYISMIFLGPAAIFGMINAAKWINGAQTASQRFVEMINNGISLTENLKASSGGYFDACKILAALKQLVVAFKELNELVKKKPELSQILTLAPDINAFVNGYRPHEKDMVKEVMSYSSNNMLFYPKNMAIFRRVYPVRWSFVKPLEAVGQIDAFVSMATLMREHQPKRNDYCFVEYDESGKTGFNLKDFWNPYLPVEKCVANSLQCGLGEAKHMLLTGPNAGGKSSTQRAVSTSLLMGMVFGVAPAKSCTMSTYDAMDSFMTAKDDPARGKSKFMAETEGVEVVRKRATMYNMLGKRIFTVVDEIYNGTGDVNAVPLALTLCKEIAATETVTALISTHFPKISEMVEAHTNNEFKNYRVTKNIGADGKVHWTFKIEPGRPDDIGDAVGIDVAEREGVPAGFIDEAKKLQKELYGNNGDLNSKKS